MSEVVNRAEADFQEVLKSWKSTLLTDTPQGRSLYAAGACFVLTQLRDDFSKVEWQRLYDDFYAFCEAYME